MRRRQFFSTLAASAAALGVPHPLSGLPPQTASARTSNFADVPPLNPGDAEAYFSEERLREAIDTSVPLQGIRFEVVAYNFPSWHPSPYMENIFGKGWTEFETLKNSRSLFPGHLFPKYPLWGFFNEAEPEWAEREIETAADYGIDVWMIDWYWHNGTMFYHEQLEDGFLKARNRSKLRFAIMWANHHWKNVYPARSPKDAATLLPQLHSEDDMTKVIDYCIEHYFPEPNYWRINGQPVFAIFDVNLLLETFTPNQLRRVFDSMRDRVAKAGLGGLHFQASHSHGGREAELKRMGFDSATLYHTFGWTYGGMPPGSRTPYGTAALSTVKLWQQTAAKMSVPFFPDCPVGWDDSPRYGSSAHMVTQRTPDQYERLLRAAQYFLAASSAQPKVVFLSAWNEWTEDHVLLPDTIYGYSYLEAVRRVFKEKG